MANKTIAITFVQPDGSKQTFDGDIGWSVMEVAKRNNVEGVDAECGGACACATCHVYVDKAFLATAGKAGDMEADMLDHAFHVKEESRLCCQIRVEAELDGLVVHVPERQY